MPFVNPDELLCGVVVLDQHFYLQLREMWTVVLLKYLCVSLLFEFAQGLCF